nr:MAG TPA: hypothetical protein [Caudoviricetes sp.]DAW72277.1 MAG TPA: hypothetical protein [Caudoviricetes sp.]
MPSGGARPRSGPPPDPRSGRSDARGISSELRVLPAAGYAGKPPPWPLPTGATRERALWKKIWRFPQAVAWADEEWRWLTIAHYVRWAVRSEAPGATPSMMTQVLRLADSIGLSPAGLLLNGWTIPTTADGSATESAATPPQQPDPPRRRLRAVKDDDDDPAN